MIMTGVVGGGAEELAELAGRGGGDLLTAVLETGEIDYPAIFRSSAIEDQFRYLSSRTRSTFPIWRSPYLRHGDGRRTCGTDHGKAIIHAMTIPRTPRTRRSPAIIGFVIGPKGESIMRANGS